MMLFAMLWLTAAKYLIIVLGLIFYRGYRIIWVIIHHYKLKFFTHPVFTEIESALVEVDSILVRTTVEENKRNLAHDYLTLFLLTARAQLKSDVEEVARVGLLGNEVTKSRILVSIKRRRLAQSLILDEQEDYPTEVIKKLDMLVSVFDGMLQDNITREIINNKILITPKLLLDIYFVNVTQYVNAVVRRQFAVFLPETNGVFKAYEYEVMHNGYYDEIVARKVCELNQPLENNDKRLGR